MGDFFFIEKQYIWKYRAERTPQKTKTLVYPGWNKMLKILGILFELMKIETHGSKNCFKMFL